MQILVVWSDQFTLFKKLVEPFPYVRTFQGGGGGVNIHHATLYLVVSLFELIFQFTCTMCIQVHTVASKIQG